MATKLVVVTTDGVEYTRTEYLHTSPPTYSIHDSIDGMRGLAFRGDAAWDALVADVLYYNANPFID